MILKRQRSGRGTRRVTRQHAQHLPLEQMREFVATSGSLSFTGADREEIYGFVEGT